MAITPAKPQRFTIFRNYIVTCNEDGSVPLSAKCAGMVMTDGYAEGLLDQLIDQANAYAAEREARCDSQRITA